MREKISQQRISILHLKSLRPDVKLWRIIEKFQFPMDSWTTGIDPLIIHYEEFYLDNKLKSF